MKPIASLALFVALAGFASAADWSTNRGNAQRTGSIDDKPGPKSPKVLWVHKATEHFIASPVPTEKSLYVSGLGTFNAPAFQTLSTDPAAKERIVWAKGPPYLKLPTVCPPAVLGNLLILGDGMHQTSGAILHALRADNGFAVWQFPVPGNLVHLEGGATVAEGRIYIGGGNAGVLCLDPSKITVEGKEYEPAALQKVLDEKWKQLLAKYEVDKKKDPDFAIAPTEDALPRAQPKLVWQKGQERWHVDASVGVSGGKVLATSAYLDQEQVGDRAAYCLDAKDGSEVWRAPLKHNPWGGPTVLGDTVIIGCSNIRFDPKEISQGQGEVVGLGLADGKEKWKRPIVKGGVLSPVAASGKLAVFTATDGKIRALDVENKGQLKWTYDAKTPLFAGAAIAGETVYAADLNGVVHAINLSNGTKVWTLDLAADPAVKSPGSVYASPVVQGGRLYVATCNLDAPAGRTGTVVVCIGDN